MVRFTPGNVRSMSAMDEVSAGRKLFSYISRLSCQCERFAVELSEKRGLCESALSPIILIMSSAKDSNFAYLTSKGSLGSEASLYARRIMSRTHLRTKSRSESSS